MPAGLLIYRTRRDEPPPLPRALSPRGRVRVVIHEPPDPLPGGPAAAPDFPFFAGELPLVDPEDSRPCYPDNPGGTPAAAGAGGNPQPPVSAAAATRRTTTYTVRWPVG